MTAAASRRRVRADAGPRYTPVELARLLRLPRPTEEQAAIISAPVEPLLVVAGAGSGKTETMAARVVWLVANAYVRPEQVLGLTFTRKAAGELAHRVRTRLGQLVRRLGRQVDNPREDLLSGEPTVATYHSYAGRVVTEHGLRSGYEPATRLLTEASRWQVVDGLVRAYAGDMAGMSSAPSTVTDAVLALAAELSEHLVGPAELSAWTGRFYAEVTARPGRMLKAVSDALGQQQLRLKLLPLVRAYAERKRELEAMDFSDQLARAAVVARDHPEVGRIERERYRVVLLDEYQDTSHAQVVMLRSLYGEGHPVTAVGDPCQSIYGWRGASAGTLERFGEQFRRPDGTPARELTLTTSWRNRPEILSVANALSAPLRRAGARVAQLSSSRRVAGALSGGATVRCALLETAAQEAEWVADRVVAAWRAAAGRPGAAPEEIPVEARPTTAVLVRLRAQIPAIEAALRARGVPVEVVGLGGLLDTPEVRDVVSTLRVLADPADGAALLRLLTGARWRIGPRDLVALHRLARRLSSRRRTERLTSPPREDPEPVEEPLPDRLDEVTLVEALAELTSPAPGFSPAGLARLRAYAVELDALRQRLDQPLPDLVADVERTLGLDVEVAVRALGIRGAGAEAGDAGLARGHLDALGDVAARFAGEAEGATLTGFLAYLAAAEEEERGLEPGEVDVVAGAAQILTAHAAKGLEWDVVAVAGLCRTQWPGRARNSDHYLQGLGVLPFPLRGDRAGLPEPRLDPAVDQKEVATALEAFKQEWQHHDEREERRLAYVAVTRPRRLLLCSGHWWGEGLKTARGPSILLTEVRAGCLAGAGVVDHWAPVPPPGATNPTEDEVARAGWPADPLGGRRAALERAAALVREHLGAERPGVEQPGGEQLAGEQGAGDPPPAASAPDEEARRWAHEVKLLLAERERAARPPGPIPVALPEHLTVSQLVTLHRDPQRLARALRRPMPARPDVHGRRGTAFHRWLEQRFGGERLLDVDELPGAADEDAAPDSALTELQERFLASEWASRVPVEVEVPFATSIGGVVVRGRMDAVFADAGGDFDVVDWKTGRRPTGADGAAAAVQLAAYRLAWASLAGVPVERVRAAFHYVREGRTVRPADLLDAEGLTALVTGIPPAEPDR
ncbi:ATP-dependent helicase [Rhizomonospora bruguierae]|uniref:ATP-dependent helicase n=1 Tax=Rhizomonospora bruguierae TaxID=1581705 RepID=UPI001BCEE5E9|nr:UvrD-helicase domain-containing protein [Micromonospora sp. NBRC 107566]